MKTLKEHYFEACIKDAKDLTILALRAKDWSAKNMSFRRAAQSLKMAGRVLNELYERERRCRDEKLLENNRPN